MILVYPCLSTLDSSRAARKRCRKWNTINSGIKRRDRRWQCKYLITRRAEPHRRSTPPPGPLQITSHSSRRWPARSLGLVDAHNRVSNTRVYSVKPIVACQRTAPSKFNETRAASGSSLSDVPTSIDDVDELVCIWFTPFVIS